MKMASENEIKLKPCPFCGSDAVTLGRAHINGAIVGAWFYFGHCGNCGANGSQSDDKGFFYTKRNEAAEAWNRRANDGE
jgi:Lar family restriction alleviation protein